MLIFCHLSFVPIRVNLLAARKPLCMWYTTPINSSNLHKQRTNVTVLYCTILYPYSVQYMWCCITFIILFVLERKHFFDLNDKINIHIYINLTVSFSLSVEGIGRSNCPEVKFLSLRRQVQTWVANALAFSFALKSELNVLYNVLMTVLMSSPLALSVVYFSNI